MKMTKTGIRNQGRRIAISMIAPAIFDAVMVSILAESSRGKGEPVEPEHLTIEATIRTTEYIIDGIDICEPGKSSAKWAISALCYEPFENRFMIRPKG